MLAVLLLSAFVATVSAQSYGGSDVKIVPHAKAVVHEEARHEHRQVPLVKQVPVVQTNVHTIVNEVPRIVKKPKIIRKTRVHRQYYPVDVPHIRKITHVKPIHLEKKVGVPRRVVVKVPKHIVKTQHVDVPIDVPVKRIVEKKVVRYVENKIFRPKPVVQDRVRVVNVPRPFPVDQVVVKKNPRPRLVVEKRPVPVIRNIHTHKKQAVAVPRVKTVAVEVPNIVRQKVPYPVGKAPGFHHGHGSVQVGVGGVAGGPVVGGAIAGGVGGGFVSGGMGTVVGGGVAGGAVVGGAYPAPGAAGGLNIHGKSLYRSQGGGDEQRREIKIENDGSIYEKF